MTERSVPGVGKGQPSTRVGSVSPLLAGWAASLIGGAAWYGLSLATGLIFHFLPAGVILAGAWAFRQAAGVRTGPAARRASPAEAVGFTTGALVVVLGTIASIGAGHRALDAPWVTALVTAVGITVAAWWIRR
ncbi:MAG TPA: hypothetical protein VMU89_00390 [Thermomicrobiaceae bacterium]|nr:hypothetical protein [Thermomicrobiaceae bacterium]